MEKKKIEEIMEVGSQWNQNSHASKSIFIIKCTEKTKSEEQSYMIGAKSRVLSRFQDLFPRFFKISLKQFLHWNDKASNSLQISILLSLRLFFFLRYSLRLLFSFPFWCMMFLMEFKCFESITVYICSSWSFCFRRGLCGFI